MALYQNEKLVRRIRSSYIKVNDHWIVEKYTNGYGKIYAEGRNWGAHQLSYLVHVGPIPEGHHLDHLCRITNCINPSHLEPVTPYENNMRGNSAASINAKKTHCKYGHPLFGDNLVRRVKDGSRQCRKCHNRRARERNARRVALRP